ncbi:MAG TPA: TonB-dependent receptor [Gemmatimonadales bacterium]|nr:TonB-dependent receptor [Gemmatimonadales bacterium]
MRVLASVLLASTFASAPMLGQTGTIRGRVADTSGTAMARVAISVDGTSLRATSSDRGEYLLTGVPAGSVRIRARLIGHTPYEAWVTVPAGGEVRHDIALTPTPISLAAIDVVVGSRARHTAAEELAVPVDVFTSEQLAQQGSPETGQILQALSPSVNFPRQSVTDATDIVRPFTLRGLSPDHTLVLLNGWRRHQTAVVNTFAYGTNAGSSGVDLNAIPSSALDRIEVLRDGAAAQYGSDAIAGVVNAVLREGPFTPFLNASIGRYATADYPDDGTTANLNGGWSTRVGRGSLSLFGELINREPTNRAWADIYEDAGTGQTDSIVGGRVVVKRNPVPQPNHHWGDGLERDVLTMFNLRMPLVDDRTREFYAFGGFSFRRGNGQGYRRYAGNYRNFTEIYPLGFLPEFRPDVVDASLAAGYRALLRNWAVELGGSFGHNGFEYNLRNTLNTSLGPCLTTPCAPGPDGILGNADDPGIPNQTSFFAGRLVRQELSTGVTATRSLDLGLPSPVNLAIGAAFRYERFQITQGERASWIDGGHLASDSSDAPGGSQVFPGFAPSDETDVSRTNFGFFADAETQLSRQLLLAAAGRFESYSDFGQAITGKLALRYAPTQQLTLRAAASTGFRAPGLGQSHFSKVVTNVIAGAPVDVGIFPVGHRASRALGSRDLREESSVNLSAGLAFSPTPNLTLTADLFRITINDRILLGATFDDDTTLAILAREGITNVGGVQYFTNGLDTRTTGLDLTANWTSQLGTGTLDLTAAVNFTENVITSIDPLPPVLQNSAEPGLIDTVTYIAITEERPDTRATLTALYTRGQWRALARASYFGEFSSAQPGYCDLCRERYGAKTLFDIEAGYRLGRFDLTLGVRNLFDTYPDQPSSTRVVDTSTGDRALDYNNNFGTFPWAAASPFGYNGRYVYARVGVPLR